MIAFRFLRAASARAAMLAGALVLGPGAVLLFSGGQQSAFHGLLAAAGVQNRLVVGVESPSLQTADLRVVYYRRDDPNGEPVRVVFDGTRSYSVPPAWGTVTFNVIYRGAELCSASDTYPRRAGWNTYTVRCRDHGRVECQIWEAGTPLGAWCQGQAVSWVR